MRCEDTSVVISLQSPALLLSCKDLHCRRLEFEAVPAGCCTDKNQ